MSSLKVHNTASFAVLDLPNVGVNAHIAPKTVAHAKESTAEVAKRIQSRANHESGTRMVVEGHIGGEFTVSQDPPYMKHRSELFDSLLEIQGNNQKALDDIEIKITLPSGDVKVGYAGKTTPFDIAKGISQGLADNIIVAKVSYTGAKYYQDTVVACEEEDDLTEEYAKSADIHVDTNSSKASELWDVNRPLVGDCELTMLKYDDPESKVVFAHSSAHILGSALEAVYGAHLTIGPPLQQGFYYDCFMGENTIHEADLKQIEAKAVELTKKKQPFQRLVVSKSEALEMFKHNPFKVSLITNKVPDNSKTTVYRCGQLIDLCIGPHVPHTGRVKAFACTKSSATNWLGQVKNDPLQRVYGVSFPDKAQLKQWLEFQKKAKERDHRLLGTKQELFFFHNLSPGSAFWLPHGARIYNKLMEFIKHQYWQRGYEEVISPNVFNLDLWHTSGHAQHYKDSMFIFDVEGQEWGMKPMNCPGHCLLFGHRLRSYRELPIRMADFGVLHRNELSGALTGLTRVRRFQQDDAHIFCTVEQIKEEILGALNFMKYVYDIFGMRYSLDLSTRPLKALGEKSVWDNAEAQLAAALDEFAGPGSWKINPGDGAFYGPKIDIKVFDALDRVHQCATVQLDFQLPIRFNLEYKSGGGDDDAFQRPVMIHRAMLGSVERMSAILMEHWGGKWPFWISPRQVVVVPVDPKYFAYGAKVQEMVHKAGFFVDLDDSSHTLNKKIREGQVAQYNYILVVGGKEEEENNVMVRCRDTAIALEASAKVGEKKPAAPQVLMSIEDFIKKCKGLVEGFY